MLKRIAITLAVTFFSLNLAFAQKADDEYRELVVEYFKLTNTESQMRTLIPAMFDNMKTLIPEVPDEYWEKVTEKFFNEGMETLITGYADIYTKYFTKEDLKTINAFYKSPVGRKMSQSVPDITKEGMEIGRKLGESIAVKVFKDLQEKGYQISM